MNLLYLCGGCVRDKILNRTFKDKDYVVITKLSFSEYVKELKKNGVKIFQVKPEFLTIRCRLNKETVDIVFPRIDGEYKDGRRPESVSSTNDLRQDASRRDFTINAMYMASDGSILDFFDGRADIENRIIRAVGNPDDRIREDYLRILRAIRFSCELNFTIEDKLEYAMRTNADGLRCISADRIRDEINRSFRANPTKTIDWIANKMCLLNILEEKGLRFELTSKG